MLVKGFLGVQFMLPMSEQEGKDKSKHTTLNEEAEEQIAQLRRQIGEAKPAKEKPGFIALLMASLSGAQYVAAVGALASYAGHKKTTEVFLWMSEALLALIPIIFLVYSGVVLHKRFSPLSDTALGRFILRYYRAILVVSIVIDLFNVAVAIFRFDRYPKTALVEIAINGALAIASYGLLVADYADYAFRVLHKAMIERWSIQLKINMETTEILRGLARDYDERKGQTVDPNEDTTGQSRPLRQQARRNPVK